MISAEPHIYITVPSVRIWIRANRGTAVAAVVAAAVLVGVIVLGIFWVI
ncbi:hypothetical protein [Mycolicibacterium alvei]|uniref:Uncharacterized protein n=1 Tax=Mycolicibacterium alvei TaxID=67081 RepID=A0A6N4UUE9_9MYCO|nr:hypothetical protein [Mycolicibacterium alvei]MCV6999595.1 hypothetical protein [Mycolicibacterium alvei]BBX28510.1 hypothetical protein MALV_36350 [Mycolicibacterium alvei]